MKRLPRVYEAEPPEPTIPYEGDPEDLPIRQAAHAALRGPWPRELVDSVHAYWDSRAGDWTENMGPAHTVPLRDALERLDGDAAPHTILELGAGTGLGTRAIEELFPSARVTATDLSARMAAQARREGAHAAMVAADSQALPIRGGAIDLVVLFNTYLFPDEVRRVLREGGVVVGAWTLGPATPIYVTAEQAEAALDGEPVVADAAWGNWWRVAPGAKAAGRSAEGPNGDRPPRMNLV